MNAEFAQAVSPTPVASIPENSSTMVTGFGVTASPRDIPDLRTRALEALAGIEVEMMTAVLNRQIYQDVRDEIVRLRPTSDATFLNSYSGLYVRAQVMTIRRLAESSDGVDSLWRLIGRIQSNPAIASRATVVQMVRERSGDDIADYADHELSLKYSGDEVPPPALLARLQDSLSHELAAVISFADRKVAHRDPRGQLQAVTFGDVHAALDHVIEIANELGSMLKYSSVFYSEITIQGDWQECLRPGLFPIEPSAYYWPDSDGYV